MSALGIIFLCLGVLIYLAVGVACGKICVEIIIRKDESYNLTIWFIVGLFLNFIAVFMTSMVKNKNENK